MLCDTAAVCTHAELGLMLEGVFAAASDCGRCVLLLVALTAEGGVYPACWTRCARMERARTQSRATSSRTCTARVRSGPRGHGRGDMPPTALTQADGTTVCNQMLCPHPREPKNNT